MKTEIDANKFINDLESGNVSKDDAVDIIAKMTSYLAGIHNLDLKKLDPTAMLASPETLCAFALGVAAMAYAKDAAYLSERETSCVLNLLNAGTNISFGTNISLKNKTGH